MKKIDADVVIVGTGVGGLFSALNLPRDKKVVMITKSDLESSDSFLAQGGICMLRDETDYDSYFEDTMKAGHYENREESVDIMIRSSQEIIRDLVGYGVEFKREEDGGFAYTREGAHSKPRILFHEDITGKEITSKLLAQVKKLENVEIYEYTMMTDIIVENGQCVGIEAKHMNVAQGSAECGIQADENREINECPEHVMEEYIPDREKRKHFSLPENVPAQFAESEGGEELQIYAPDTILASGGVGGLYKHSTNFPHLTGDALEISKRHGIRLEHLDYVQIHPTTLYSTKPGRRFLISESVRGEGAVLYNKGGERFVNELLPRDVVAQAIREQMKKDGTDFVWLSLEHIPKETILGHFPNIYRHCLEEGYDVTKEPIPVVPAQHYFMGGIWVDSDSRASMPHLYAVGETSCNGVHGANRLASNSLLESLVFAKRAVTKIRKEREE